MSTTPVQFQLRLEDFDFSRLPIAPELLRSNPDLLRQAISEYYTQYFRKLGGTAAIAVREGLIEVSWTPKAGNAREVLSEEAIRLLGQGDRKSAEPLLRSLLSRFPGDPVVLYNYGMLLSDQGRLEEAVQLLQHLVSLTPGSANAWTALGVALFRQGQKDKALQMFRRAIEAEPGNGYALRSAGACILESSPNDALPFLEKAAQALPEDQLAQFALGRCLLMLGRAEEADRPLKVCIELAPLSETAKRARMARSNIAHKTMRKAVSGEVRPDVVAYCLGALQRFRELGDAQTRTITFEIAMLGRGGLDINNPNRKYTLRSLPGQFTGMHLLSIMYVGLQLINPGADAGIDLSREYQQAKRLFEAGAEQ